MKKILLIEDDQLVANIYRNKFSVENFEAETASDGETGFDLVNSFHPDVVVLDLMLPKVTGLDVLKKIRAHPVHQQMPVIVFSNTYLSSIVQDAWKAGATKCLSKANCTPKQLLEVVRTLLSPTPNSNTDTATTGRKNEKVEKKASENDSDREFQAELRQSFVSELPATLAGLRMTLQAMAKSGDEAGRVRQLQELYRRVHALTGNSGIAGLHEIAQMADALEALLKELYEKPRNINASTLRTVALAIDFLGVLFDQAKLPPPATPPPEFKPNILVVDDEAISRRAVTYALDKAKLPCVNLENPEAALKMLAEKNFDLVFLDVDMPGMTGFELCTKLRGLARNKNTPVVFVTSLTDFESRANSTMSGGNDLIAKPFLFMELTVKALIFLLRGRMAATKQ